MINYEISKKLKEAGFPQSASPKGINKWNGYVYFPNGKKLQPKNDLEEFTKELRNICYKDKTPLEVCVYEPTLSELIEACGDNFYSLTKDEPISGIYRFGKFYCSTTNPVLRIGGDTLEEAVANLYIELNK